MLFKHIERSKQDKIIKWVLKIILILVFVWYALIGVQLSINSSIIGLNTENVKNSKTKVSVNKILEDGTMFLDDTRKLKDSDISEYVKVAPGTGTYILEDNYMSVELTKSEAWKMSYSFMLLGVITILLVFLIKKSTNAKVLICSLILIIAWITLEGFNSNVLLSKIPFTIILVGILIIVILICMLQERLKKS